MKPQHSIPVPARMQQLPRDQRGYPVPVIVLRDNSGRPHFTMNDEAKRQRIILSLIHISEPTRPY